MPGPSGLQWYVIQVITGQEAKMCQYIQAACDAYNHRAAERAASSGVAGSTAGSAVGAEDTAASNVAGGVALVLDEVFAPRFRGQKKYRGEWREVEYPLMPGYIIAVVDDPAKLAQALRAISDPCRLVTPGETYVPLTDYERSWIEACTERGDRVVPMSIGQREGDVLTVTQGPLKGYEGRISKVDRANSLAQLEFHVGQITIKTTVGLGLVPKR